jgi:hypothetical protein
MSDVDPPDLEARIRAEVDRAVAPYEGVVPPFMLAKLRELSERYWRESPVAARALRIASYQQQARSAEVAVSPEGAADDGAKGAKEA